MKDKEIKKKSSEEITDEELDELMIKTSREQIRSDYRRSLGGECTRRGKDISKKKQSDK